MQKQLIISIGREFGSGGHTIADILAKRFDIQLYDANLLDELTQGRHMDYEELMKYDETPRNILFSRRVKGLSNSPEETTAELQFKFLKAKANKGQSFVIVGRCSETVLRSCKGLVSVFILADMPDKIKRISKMYGVSSAEAQTLIERRNKARKAYHNYFCTGKWGDSRNYDISVNSSRLGTDGTAELLEYYIKKKFNN